MGEAVPAGEGSRYREDGHQLGSMQHENPTYRLLAVRNALRSRYKVNVNKRELAIGRDGVVQRRCVFILAEALLDCANTVPKAQLLLRIGPCCRHRIDLRPVLVS